MKKALLDPASEAVGAKRQQGKAGNPTTGLYAPDPIGRANTQTHSLASIAPGWEF